MVQCSLNTIECDSRPPEEGEQYEKAKSQLYLNFGFLENYTLVALLCCFWNSFISYKF